MNTDNQERTVDLTVYEIELLQALVQYKTENVIEHSPEYFQLRDIAFKLETARKTNTTAARGSRRSPTRVDDRRAARRSHRRSARLRPRTRSGAASRRRHRCDRRPCRGA